ncbi:PTS system iic component [Listeria floridensis FSL S10-1187]|uniref:Permease IIC component n=1 Tax=Listeria floridensis FSL S10-1187 TaxID=1265817 RepID=A0ABN0RE58_9LIST|nr:PTS transporter subunit EIIC [Listeria floridensis]EUJ30744.1 PTS system iic component [Listeria floridensis FSL S10-1187]
METLERFLNKFIGPVASRMNRSKFFSALAEAFMRTTPITLGVALLMIIGNFPIPAWINLLAKTGLTAHFNAALGATINLLSVYVAFNFAYVYAKKDGRDPLPAGLLGIASFFLLMPQSIQTFVLGKNVTEFPAKALIKSSTNIEAFQTLYTGGSGLFVAILVGYIVGLLYCFLVKKNITIKMPDSVPKNVSESLSPAILSGIILAIFFIVRVLFSYTPFESIFTFISTLVQLPLQNLTASPIAIILIFTIANLLWFFGIHPNMVYGVVMPMLTANMTANMVAFQHHQELPYLAMAIVSYVCGNGFGGQGATYGLAISMFRAKSARYKQLLKLAGPPVLFNINEPLIFGMPLMLNPYFFIPMVISPILMGGTAWAMMSFLDFSAYNPLIAMPFTTPAPIVMFLKGGFNFLIVFIVLLIINILTWYPFFKVADRKEYETEQELARENTQTAED